MIPALTPMKEQEATMLNPLQLAYIGDTVWDLLVRTSLMFSGRNVHGMHMQAVAAVNAAAQAKALAVLREQLTDQELEIVRRGRNSQARHPVPRHQNAADYGSATGLEALVGFLYITGRQERLEQLFALSRKEADPCQGLK